MKANPDYFDPIYIFIFQNPGFLITDEWAEYHWTKEEALSRAQRDDRIIELYEKSMWTGLKKKIWERK